MYQTTGYGTSNGGYSAPSYGSSYASSNYQNIETIVLSEPMTSQEAPTVLPYVSGSYSGLYLNKPKHIEPEIFLTPDRDPTPIIKSETKIMPFIEETFLKQTGEEFPHDKIILNILDEKEFRKAALKHTNWGPGLQGFALNNIGRGKPSTIFVKRNHLDSMMMTIGHEIGHVMSPQLPNSQDEEAKAISFSMAWVETIKEHNIAGIAHNIVPRPANNGLHDVAYEFVLELMDKGKDSLQVFKDVANGIYSITKKLETITMEA